MDILIFGAGYSGRAFADEGKGARIAGTTRSTEKFARLRAAGIEPFVFTGEMFSADLAARLASVTHLVVSAAPDASGDPVLRAGRDTILNAMPSLAWIGYLSTVGVYGDHRGAWVDEDTQCHPRSQRSVQRVAAEQEWLALGRERDVPVALLRLSGIYGPGRNALVNLANGTAKRLVKPGQVFNRIHVADIAGSLWHLARGEIGGAFNVTDDEPAPPQDVVAYAADLMGVAPPPETPFETADLTPMARSFYGENKRVSNGRLRATGYDFRYPDYRAALDALWRDGNWRGMEGEGRSAIREG